jgi:anti-sigma factor RsiW
MDCGQARDLMDGYTDGELDPVTASAIERHLQTCAACKQAYAQQSALRGLVRHHAAYYTAPAALTNRIREQTAALGARVVVDKRTPRWQWLPLVTAVAATAVVTWIAATLQIQTAASDERMTQEVIAGHARGVLTNHLVDVASSDRHTVKPWLSARLDFSPPVVDLASAEFPLVGGRVDYLDNRPVAALVFHHRQHVITLFVWPEAGSGGAAPVETSSKQGYNVLHWTDAGMTFWAISDLNTPEVKAFAQAYISQK